MGASYGPSDEQDKRTELFVVISSCYCSYNYWPDFIEGTVCCSYNKVVELDLMMYRALAVTELKSNILTQSYQVITSKNKSS